MVTDARETLQAQHRRVAELLEELRRQPHVREDLQAGQLKAIQALIGEVTRTYVTQQAIRHRHLWPVVTHDWPDRRQVRTRLRQQSREIEHLLVKLRWFGDRDSEIDDVLMQLSDAIHSQQDYEAEQLARWRHDGAVPEVDAAVTRVDWTTPTRPHPDLPGWPMLARVVGAPVALVDRIADLTRFRPTGS